MRVLTMNTLRSRAFSRCAVYLCNQKEVAALSRNKLRVNDVRADFPIEKVSLSRGLTMNKFEKPPFQDFLIYPEYADTDDVRTIQGFTEVLRKSLELTTDREELEKHGSLPDGVRGALNDCTVFSALIFFFLNFLMINLICVPFDGVNFQNLSLDWNIHANVAVVSSVVNALLLFGSDEIKDKYFPLIVSGKCRPIIAVIDDKGIDSCSEIFGTGRTNALLRIKNTRCVGVNNANIAIMLATSTHHESYHACFQKIRYCSCYIIDRTELKESDTWEFTRDETFGLKAFDVGLLNVAASISERQLVGKLGQGPEVMDELVSCACLPLAAATIGYSKRLLRDLAAICNKTPSRKENAMVSDETSSQYITTEFALKVYALESASYYLAGLLDERMPVVVDIENALVHKLTQDVLLSSISTTMELAKVQASNPSIRFEKDIRDVVTLLSLVSLWFNP
uniref:Glycerol-3-phosphate dehydrogenase [NAD(+)] n=1 Tax=Angiostrongylus cantonensis TaxID=6313 RepID=A0A158PC15_ANGCA